MPDSSLSSGPYAARSTPAVAEPSAEITSRMRVSERGGSIRLALSGELDLAARPRPVAALDAAQTDSDRVVRDLAGPIPIDCARLFVAFAAPARNSREDPALSLFNPRGQVRRMFDLVGAPVGAVILDRRDLPYDPVETPA